MITILFGLLVQAQQPARQPAAAPVPPTAAQTQATRDPQTPYDSTVAAIRRIGLAVAEVKSGLEGFNRAVAREPNAVVVERALRLQQRCQALSRSAAEGGRGLCRTCLRGQQAAAIERYRANLASLQRVGSQCSTAVERARRPESLDSTAVGLKRQARTIRDRIVAGLVPYEERLEGVRQAFGWSANTSQAPRRAN